MADGLRVELSEEALMSSPGGAVTTRCTVYNASLIVDEYRLSVTGVDPSWIEAPPATARIFPESFETLTIQFRPPRSASVAAGDYPFTVSAASADNPALTASVSGVLTVGPFVDFGMDLDSPRQLSGEVEGVYAVRVSNLGNARLTIGLEAGEETGEIEFAFPNSPLELGPGESKPGTVVARPRTVRLGGTGAVYQITITAVIDRVLPPMDVPEEAIRRATMVTFQHMPGVHEPPVLEPQTVELAGQTTQTSLVLTNRSAVPIVMGLEGADKAQALEFEFVGGNRVQVPPGQELRVPVRITCLDRTKLAPPPSPTSYTIIATPIEPAGDPRTVQGDLTQPGPADFRLRLEPETVESTATERVQLTIENVSPRAATFTIAATSKDAALLIALGVEKVDIPANDRIVVPVELSPKEDGLAAGGGAKASGYSIRVAPSDAPARVNEVTGQYVFTPAAIAMRLVRKEIEAPAEATFDVEIENTGRSDVSISMEASDRAGACQYAFDLQRLRVGPRSTVLVRLTVTPPTEHKPDARWQFEVVARPTFPAGPAINEEGILIYRPPTVGLTLAPSERRGRRARFVDVMLTNPTQSPITVKLTATDRSGGLGVVLKQDTIEAPPAGRGAVKVPLKLTPFKRQRGSGQASLSFNVAATPISPPGDAVTAEGRFVALPPRSRWFWVLIGLVLLFGLLLSPLYEEAFYVAGWDEQRTFEGQTWSGEHHFLFPWNEPYPSGRGETRPGSDIHCLWDRITGGNFGDIRGFCFAQGPRPEGEDELELPVQR
ncbi:MAG: hypothetical protein ACRDJW_14240 [Thermomicrobiales bacterium]